MEEEDTQFEIIGGAAEHKNFFNGKYLVLSVEPSRIKIGFDFHLFLFSNGELREHE